MIPIQMTITPKIPIIQKIPIPISIPAILK